jgi:hypothetical protein
MKKSLGEILGRKDITQQRGWVIVNDNKIISSYTLFEDAVKDKRGHLMSEEYYRMGYVNQPQY